MLPFNTQCSITVCPQFFSHPSIYLFITRIHDCVLFSLSLPENKETVPLGKSVKEEKEGDSLEVLHQCKTTSLANSIEQGSTLRDLLTTTAGKLKLGSTDAGIAFAPVYSTASQVHGQLPVTPVTGLRRTQSQSSVLLQLTDAFLPT